MEYKIEIKGMHCSGCSNLIKMTLEDGGLANVKVDVSTGSATFESDLNEKSKVKEILDKVFTDLTGYTYGNIKII
jgi:copper chaperone CopZ